MPRALTTHEFLEDSSWQFMNMSLKYLRLVTQKLRYPQITSNLLVNVVLNIWKEVSVMECHCTARPRVMNLYRGKAEVAGSATRLASGWGYTGRQWGLKRKGTLLAKEVQVDNQCLYNPLISMCWPHTQLCVCCSLLYSWLWSCSSKDISSLSTSTSVPTDGQDGWHCTCESLLLVLNMCIYLWSVNNYIYK